MDYFLSLSIFNLLSNIFSNASFTYLLNFSFLRCLKNFSLSPSVHLSYRRFVNIFYWSICAIKFPICSCKLGINLYSLKQKNKHIWVRRSDNFILSDMISQGSRWNYRHSTVAVNTKRLNDTGKNDLSQ